MSLIEVQSRSQRVKIDKTYNICLHGKNLEQGLYLACGSLNPHFRGPGVKWRPDAGAGISPPLDLCATQKRGLLSSENHRAQFAANQRARLGFKSLSAPAFKNTDFSTILPWASSASPSSPVFSSCSSASWLREHRRRASLHGVCRTCSRAARTLLTLNRPNAAENCDEDTNEDCPPIVKLIW